MREDDIDLSKLVELIVLLVKERAARCRLPMSQRTITLRARDCWKCVPGQLVSVDPNKHWTHAGHSYLSGRIQSSRIDADSDPINQAGDRYEAGEFEEAQTLLAGLLEADLRCLDDHAHLGKMCFDREVERALNHFEAGVRIGELSLDDSFNGLLPWFRLDNRPFLRCLNGYAMCLWCCQRWEEAQRAFEYLLALDPLDTFDIQTSLRMIAAHEQWPDD